MTENVKDKCVQGRMALVSCSFDFSVYALGRQDLSGAGWSGSCFSGIFTRIFVLSWYVFALKLLKVLEPGFPICLFLIR